MNRIRLIAFVILVACISGRLLSCSTRAADPVPLPRDVKPMQAPGIHNMFSVGTNLFSGSAPEGDAAFAALEKLGVKTIITVDGSKPDVGLAHKHGMRYVHLPHGYDGIDANTEARLIKAAESLDGPFYLHCHHGKHRGPAAVSVICMSELGWTAAEADAWLRAAGTATNYAGLYDVPRKFQKPTAEQLKALPSEFPEVSRISGLTDAMVGIDERWDNLKAIRAAGYKAPEDHPDMNPANEMVILWEHFREAQRFPEAIQHGPKLIEGLAAAENHGKYVERILRAQEKEPSPELQALLDAAFTDMTKACASCHKDFRDPSGIKFRSK